MDAVDSEPVRRAIDALRRGGVIVYPTETVYGLGADATSDAALRRVAALKGRASSRPILVIVSSREMLARVVSRVPADAEPLIAEFWPGPLTLVLPARAGLSPILTGGRGSIGVRISSHPLAAVMVDGLGQPLTSTSANPGGLPPGPDAARARAYFGSKVDAYVDGGPCVAARGSTVVDLSGTKAVLVREGAIPAAAIERAGVRLRAL